MYYNVKKDFAMVGAFMLRSGMASGNRVDAHIIVSKYWFPLFVFGNGPTQYIITREKDSSHAGMGINGAFGIFRFGFPTS